MTTKISTFAIPYQERRLIIQLESKYSNGPITYSDEAEEEAFTNNEKLEAFLASFGKIKSRAFRDMGRESIMKDDVQKLVVTREPKYIRCRGTDKIRFINDGSMLYSCLGFEEDFFCGVKGQIHRKVKNVFFVKYFQVVFYKGHVV